MPVLVQKIAYLLPHVRRTRENVMKSPLRTVLGLCLVFLLSAASAPLGFSEPESKPQQIRELLELTGSADLGIQLMEGMITQLRQAMPQVPAEWWDACMAEVSAEDLINLVVPIYEKNFTDQEILAMLEFYRTPLGQSIISKMPTVMQESMVAGQAWGESLAKDVLHRLKADGYELPPGLQS